MANAETRAQRIPGVKDYYRRIESEMRSLVARERAPSNSVARTQISVRVIQGKYRGYASGYRGSSDLGSNDWRHGAEHQHQICGVFVGLRWSEGTVKARCNVAGRGRLGGCVYTVIGAAGKI